MTKLSRFKTFEAKKTKEETPGKVEIKALHAFLLHDEDDEQAGEFCKALAKKKSGSYSPDVELIKPGDVQEYKFKGVSYKVTEVPDENSITHDWRVERKIPKKTKINEASDKNDDCLQLYKEVIVPLQNSDIKNGTLKFDVAVKDIIEEIQNINYGNNIRVSVGENILHILKKWAINVGELEFQKLVDAVFNDKWKNKYNWTVEKYGVILQAKLNGRINITRLK